MKCSNSYNFCVTLFILYSYYIYPYYPLNCKEAIRYKTLGYVWLEVKWGGWKINRENRSECCLVMTEREEIFWWGQEFSTRAHKNKCFHAFCWGKTNLPQPSFTPTPFSLLSSFLWPSFLNDLLNFANQYIQSLPSLSLIKTFLFGQTPAIF